MPCLRVSFTNRIGRFRSDREPDPGARRIVGLIGKTQSDPHLVPDDADAAPPESGGIKATTPEPVVSRDTYSRFCMDIREYRSRFAQVPS